MIFFAKQPYYIQSRKSSWHVIHIEVRRVKQIPKLLPFLHIISSFVEGVRYQVEVQELCPRSMARYILGIRVFL